MDAPGIRCHEHSQIQIGEVGNVLGHDAVDGPVSLRLTSSAAPSGAAEAATMISSVGSCRRQAVRRARRDKASTARRIPMLLNIDDPPCCRLPPVSFFLMSAGSFGYYAAVWHRASAMRRRVRLPSDARAAGRQPPTQAFAASPIHDAHCSARHHPSATTQATFGARDSRAPWLPSCRPFEKTRDRGTRSRMPRRFDAAGDCRRIELQERVTGLAARPALRKVSRWPAPRNAGRDGSFVQCRSEAGAHRFAPASRAA